MNSTPSIASLAAALSLAQGELADATKSSTNPAFKAPDKPGGSKYADLAEVLQTLRPVLAKHDLAFAQGLSTRLETDGTLHAVCTTRLMHKSGEWIEDSVSCPCARKDAQGYGAASTYLRRYSIAAMCGISQDDDDGNAASPRTTPEEGPKKKGKHAEVSAEDFDSLKAKFEAAQTKEDVTKLVGEFTKLPPAQQTQMIPFATAARSRAGM